LPLCPVSSQHGATENAQRAGKRGRALGPGGPVDELLRRQRIGSLEYDPFGRRIEATLNGQTTYYYLYGASDGGHPIAENAGGGCYREVIMDGVRWGWLYQNGDGRYTLPDALGSTAVFAQDGTVEASRLYPFGEEAQATGAEYKWTNQIRDGKGLDHFAFRTYSSNLARWLSPDPAGLAAVDPADPQSWNSYAYVENTPLESADPLGLTNGLFWGSDGCLYLGEDENTGGRFVQTVTLIDCPNEEGPPPLDPNPPTGEAPTAGMGGAGGPQPDPAPQAQAPPWYKNSCVTGALGKGALSVGIDSIGLIPEAGGIARVIGHQAGYVGVVADQAGSRLIGAVNATANTGRGLAGLTDTSPTGLASTGLTIAGFIPGLNDAAAVGSIGLDLFRTAKAIGACY